MEKKLMLGNEAVARGLYEAGCRFVSSYPGTPSTEITEFAAKYPEVYAEWAPNEKVAAEAAFGASLGGARAFTAMKHVGLNVAADLMFTASYTGVNAGFVLAVADDMGMHSSQNEQDSRHYAAFAKVPMLEPADSQECADYIKQAFAISEEYDTPVLLRLSTRISHSRSAVETGACADIALRPYVKDASKYVMMPSNARPRHVAVEARTERLRTLADRAGAINRIIPGDAKIGVIAAGSAFQYAREALGDRATYLKLGLLYPLPEQLMRDFAAGVDCLYVIEELDDVIETQVRRLGIPVQGKALFSPIGEYTPARIRKAILGTEPPALYEVPDAPVRPPVLCPGCPHRGIFYVMGRLRLTVMGDIGCYTLGAAPPLGAMDTCIDMGASVSMTHGMNAVRSAEDAQKTVAVLGDSTFIHSGITGLVNIVYNGTPSTVLILDNSITGMTGHQENPTTGHTLQEKEAPQVDLETLCRACGVRRVRVVDPADMSACEQALREELAADEPSVIIARRPCALLKSVKRQPALRVENCKKCRVCMRIGCPAIRFEESGAVIDAAICVGCGLCADMCRFGCIKGQEVGVHA